MIASNGRRPFNPAIAGVLAGLVIIAVVTVMAMINVNFAAPWARTHTVTAQVQDADGIAVSSDVRVAGRLVGQVTAVTAAGDHADVTFHVDDSEWPLPADSRASVRLATLLGQKYIQIDPGTSRSRLADNATISLDRTRSVVDFDQVLDTFDQPTRTALTRVIATGGAAVQGQEGTIQQLLPTLRQLARDSQRPTAVLQARDADINSILINLGTTADQLNQSRDDLAGVIASANSVTGALATHNGAALQAFIANTDQLNRTTDAVLGNGGAAQLNAGLVRVDTLAHQADTLVTDLLPQTEQFRSSGALDAALQLNLRIGDAISQSSRSGYFLRQNPQGVDLSGLLPVALPGLPSLPTLPTLPGLTPPPAPTVPHVTPGSPGPKLPVPTPGLLPVPGPPSVPGVPSLPPLPPLPSLPPPPTLPPLAPGGALPASDPGGGTASLADAMWWSA